jgi:anthranilate phosphoribosyltransferase
VSEATAAGVREFTWSPADFGLAAASLAELAVDGPEQSAAMIRSVLTGHPGPASDIVVANAAAALWTAGKAETPLAAAKMAATSIDTGAASELLSRLVSRTK